MIVWAPKGAALALGRIEDRVIDRPRAGKTRRVRFTAISAYFWRTLTNTTWDRSFRKKESGSHQLYMNQIPIDIVV
jgi:hypothetical protein